VAEKQRPELIDELIREAIALELDCIETPSAEKAWAGIRAGLEHSRTPAARKAYFTWSRLAAVAAACLIIVAGGIGLLRSTPLAVPAADSEISYSADDHMSARDMEGEEDIFTAMQENGVQEDAGQEGAGQENGIKAAERVDEVDQPLIFGEPDQMAADWPLVISENLFLTGIIDYTAGGEPFHQGGVYTGDDTELLLVRTEVTAGEDIALFIDQLEAHMETEIGDSGELNGFIQIETDELTGLAWQDSGLNQALIVLSGEITDEELISILLSLAREIN
jgi:hypothetical protein